MVSNLLSLFLVLTIPVNPNYSVEEGKPTLKPHYCQVEDSVIVPDSMYSSWAQYVDDTQETTCQRIAREMLINIKEY